MTKSGDGAAPPVAPLTNLGWTNFFAQQIDADALTETPPVRVSQVHRNAFHVLGDGIDQTVATLPDTTIGDWLLLDLETGAPLRRLERTSLLKRRAAGHDRTVQLIAANIDTAFITTSCNADFNIARLERYIALVMDAGVAPVILLTKPDLSDEVDSYRDRAEAISEAVPVVVLDARGDDPLHLLAPWCKAGQTVAFLGSSGVGKSTLTNALSAAAIKTSDIREDDARGRHTTTSRHMHIVPGGCAIIDTPGMRELQLTEAAAGLDELFSDLFDLSTACRFNDCKHDTEPGCAILAALEDGTIDIDRLQRWRKLQAEDAFNSADLATRRQKDKQFGKMVRSAVKHKKR